MSFVDNGRIVCNHIIFSSTIIIVVLVVAAADFLMLCPVLLSIQSTEFNQVSAGVGGCIRVNRNEHINLGTC